ncbi:MAG: Peptidase M23 family protein [Candidatus Azambacteria bacterium GW2011_GWA1_44_9]|uniref:Peptidase M23 family protein n=1 Tax=Candidatus Azambacteria bacterium GW2011_GWA1_44_9 TaxID=1618610 RepID=A0A0G1NAB3_9BACT|nr:MAG: Peptidase M23 family protein [Candidatus Azambacteria bacterium GW2011_GWA1_44_9]
MFKRGVMQKKVWHSSVITLSAFGIITSGIFGGQTIISATFPGVVEKDPRFPANFDPEVLNDPVLNSFYDTKTVVSEKPRAEIIEYEVQSGDTISGVADKFDVSADTIKWANDLTNVNAIKPGQTLKILPVSGVAHTVKSGDTLVSVAKKYSAEQQPMVDFPFNDIPDDLSLKVGQVLIIPDGVPPQAPITSPSSRRAPQFLAQGPASQTFSAPGGGSFVWPTNGIMTQYFSWYHPGIDIANRAAPGVAASDGGRVVVAGWPDNFGFGNRVVIDHGNGYQTTYAHLSNIYVAVGQTISRGQIIGQMGSTGRSTGTHLHLEIRYRGIAVNPLAILK